MGRRQTLTALAAVGFIGAAGLGLTYAVMPDAVEDTFSDVAALVGVNIGAGAQDDVSAEEAAAELPAPLVIPRFPELPTGLWDTYLRPAERVYDEMDLDGDGPKRVRLYEADVRFNQYGPPDDWWLVLVVDRRDGTQIVYQDWLRNGSIDAMAFFSDGEWRFYEHSLVRIYLHDGTQEVIRDRGIGDPLFNEGASQLEGYLFDIYDQIGTYEERHPTQPPSSLQEADLELLRDER